MNKFAATAEAPRSTLGHAPLAQGEVLASRLTDTPSEVATALIEAYDMHTIGDMAAFFLRELRRAESLNDKFNIEALQFSIARVLSQQAALPSHCVVRLVHGEWRVTSGEFTEELP